MQTENFIMLAVEESVKLERIMDIDFQLLHDSILTIIAVFVLFLMLSHFLFNPVRKFLNARQEKIKEELETAAKEQSDAIALKVQYEEKVKDINKEAEEILSQARQKALANESKIIAKAKEEALRIIEKANTEAELSKQKVVDDVKKEMISIASIMAGKVVSASIDTTIQNSLIDETLKEIGESTWLS